MKKISRVIYLVIVFILVCPLQNVKAITTEELFSELKPQIIITNYSIENDTLLPGENSTVKITIKNTNLYANAYNILLSYYTNDNSVYPIYGTSNQVYIEKIGVGESVDVEFELAVNKDFQYNASQLFFSIEYNDISGSSYTNETGIYLPVSSVCKIEVTEVNLPSEISFGDSTRLYISYKNTGSINASNLIMLINGNISEDKKEIALDDLNAGANSFYSLEAVFQEKGEQELSIMLTYEDSNGNRYLVESDTITVNVVTASQSAIDNTNITVTPTMTIADSTAELKENSEKLEAWMLFVAAGAIALIGVTVWILFRKK